ncbi:MAG: ParB N-terminal domain-containing protein, partial [Candidatus Hodarchaeota archaeon]
MNKPAQIEVYIDQIDFNDRSYVFTFKSPICQLVSSIKQIGLINSPILERKTNNTFRIVSGSKRILALRHLEIEQFQAQVYYSKS